MLNSIIMNAIVGLVFSLLFIKATLWIINDYVKELTKKSIHLYWKESENEKQQCNGINSKRKFFGPCQDVWGTSCQDRKPLSNELFFINRNNVPNNEKVFHSKSRNG